MTCAYAVRTVPPGGVTTTTRGAVWVPGVPPCGACGVERECPVGSGAVWSRGDDDGVTMTGRVCRPPRSVPVWVGAVRGGRAPGA